MMTLVGKEVIYLSPSDESSFFGWLKSIQCVRNVRGVGDEILVDVDDGAVTDTDLRELLALFHRYRVDMKQLKHLVTKANEHWFRDDTNKYWHDAVFGK